jgi:hypothetical protein
MFLSKQIFLKDRTQNNRKRVILGRSGQVPDVGTSDSTSEPKAYFCK